MQRVAIESSNLAAAGWEDGTLEVEFKSGSVYAYPNVPEEVYRAMLAAPSVGAFFHKNIRSLPFERKA